MNLAELARHKTVLDTKDLPIAKVYAEALYRAAEQQGQAEEVLAELEALVGEVFGRDQGVELFLSSPSVGRERKADALKAAFEGRSAPLLYNFLRVLNDHDRLALLRGIVTAYRALHEQRSGRIQVFVRAAVSLSDDQRQRLLDDVRAVAGREPVLHEAVEPELLGGLVVRVGDWVYDASVRARLHMIRNQLIERSSHAIEVGRDR